MKLVQLTCCLLVLLFLNNHSISAQDITLPPEETVLSQISEIDLQLDILGRPSVNAIINGEELSIRVDLGANGFVLSEEAVDRLGLTPKDSDIEGIPFPVVGIDEIKIGEATFYGMSAGVVDFLTGYGDGLIGYPTFEQILVSFDFHNDKLILQPGELPEADGSSIVKWIREDRGRRPDVLVTMGKLEEPAVLDTQADGWLSMPDSLMSEYNIIGTIDTIEAFGPTRGEMIIQKARVNETMVIGQYTVVNPIVHFRNVPGMLVGTDFLNHFVVTIDQKNDRIQFQKSGSTVIEAPEEEWETRNQHKNVSTTPSGNEYVGTYGNRNILFEDGELYLQRTDAHTVSTNPNEQISAPKLLLVRDEPDHFHLQRIPTAKIKFGRDSAGQVTELHVLNMQGEWEITTKES